jgi:PAS domain S-box-containing protein
MPRLTRQSLRLRLIIATEAVLLATLALMSWYGMRLLDESLLSQLRTRVREVEPLLTAAIEPPMASGKIEVLESVLSQIKADESFVHLVIFDASGSIYASRGWDGARPLPQEDSLDQLPPGPAFHHRIALTHGGMNLGSVRYALSLDLLHEARARLLREGGLIAAAGLVSVFLLMLYLGWAMTRELARINAGAREMAEGNLAIRLVTSAKGELGQLAHSLNTLAASLEARLVEVRANEERLGLVIQGTSDGIWDWDLLSGQRYHSPRFRELLGYRDEKAFRLAYDDAAALHPEDRDRVIEAQKAHLDDHRPFDEEFRLRCANGEFRWFRGRAQAAWDAAGRPRRYAGSITDIHDSRVTEQALRESEQRFQHVVRGSTDGIWDWDLKHERYHISARMKTLLGYADDELADDRASFFVVMHPDDRARVKSEIARHFTERIPFDTELRLRHKDGSLIWFHIRGQAVWGEKGDVVRFSGACTDIMAHKQSEERIRQLLTEKQVLIDSVMVGIAYVKNGAIINSNRRIEELFGYRASELAGQPAAMLFRDRQAFDLIERECRSMTEARPMSSRELELSTQSGDTFWGIVTCRALNREAPAEDSVWIFLDNSDRRRAIEAVRQERDFSDALIKSMPGVFYLVDRDGRFLRWNRNLEGVTGHSREALAAMRGLDLFAMEDHPVVQEATYRTLKLGEYQGELPLLTRDGQRVPYLMTGVRIEIEGLTHIIGIGFDISPRRQAEDEVRRLNEELENRVRARTAELAAANKELESFSYSVSHDLSAPLRGIDGFSRMLVEDFAPLLPDVGRSYITRIRAATHRMQLLIDDLLRLSRVTRDELKRGPVNLSGLADELLEELRSAHPERVVTTRVAPSLIVTGDRNLLRIAMSNLLRNAWKFTSRNASATIEFGVLRNSDQTVYFVQDDGAGFDMRYAGRLFGAFHRLHRASEFEGTGIGLALVSRILLRHGGRIWAEAEIDKGATFFFTLG